MKNCSHRQRLNAANNWALHQHWQMESTCTIKTIAETIGGASRMERQIPLNKSLKNSHIVCCTDGK